MRESPPTFEKRSFLWTGGNPLLNCLIQSIKSVTRGTTPLSRHHSPDDPQSLRQLHVDFFLHYNNHNRVPRDINGPGAVNTTLTIDQRGGDIEPTHLSTTVSSLRSFRASNTSWTASQQLHPTAAAAYTFKRLSNRQFFFYHHKNW